MAQVILENLTKRYGSVAAVCGLDLAVQPGELVVLVGPSGCGKTTTLRMIAGLELPTSGRICIAGRVVNDLRPQERQVAMVFQHGALYPHLDVYHNLAFSLKLRRRPTAEIDRQVRDAARLLGIEELLPRYPWQLSGGQRQRVAVGRAMVRRPEVFLLDEPLSNLDGPLRNTLRTELMQLQQQLAATMILVTHDQLEAMTMGQRIAVMIAGRIEQVGPPLTVYDAPATRAVAEFIGSPTMRFLSGTLQAESAGWQLALGLGRVPLPLGQQAHPPAWHNRPVTVGIRPEAVRDVLPADADGPWLPLRAEVTQIQPLGAETILELCCGGQGLTARVDARRSYQRGQIIDAYLNSAQCHLFDPASGVRL
jgi:multiple sugar transport system ATP-binding protein